MEAPETCVLGDSHCCPEGRRAEDVLVKLRASREAQAQLTWVADRLGTLVDPQASITAKTCCLRCLSEHRPTRTPCNSAETQSKTSLGVPAGTLGDGGQPWESVVGAATGTDRLGQQVVPTCPLRVFRSMDGRAPRDGRGGFGMKPALPQAPPFFFHGVLRHALWRLRTCSGAPLHWHCSQARGLSRAGDGTATGLPRFCACPLVPSCCLSP